MDRTSKPVEFDGDTWKLKALEDYVSYKALHDFVTSEGALHGFVNSLKYHAQNPECFPDDAESSLRRRKRQDIEGALKHYASQTLVSLCTCYEVAVKDYFRCVFSAHPDKLFSFIGPDGAKGHVSLRDITRHDTKQELLDDLARRGAAIAARGEYGKSLVRAGSISAFTSEIDTLELSTLQRTRNSVVHEKRAFDFSLVTVTKAHNTVDAAIEYLCKMGIGAGIPGSYTCVGEWSRAEVEGAAFLGSMRAT